MGTAVFTRQIRMGDMHANWINPNKQQRLVILN